MESIAQSCLRSDRQAGHTRLLSRAYSVGKCQPTELALYQGFPLTYTQALDSVSSLVGMSGLVVL